MVENNVFAYIDNDTAANNNQSFLNTLTNSELSGVTTDLAEVAFDAILKDGFLKDITFISIFIGVYKGVLYINDQMFGKKVIVFLASLNTISIQ